MSVDLTSAHRISEAVRSRDTSAREVVSAALARIAEVEPTLHAYLDLNFEGALSRADEIDAQVANGACAIPLAGVPVAVKDNICTRGRKTTCGSRILENYIPPYDATAVARLERAGAVVIGKTNCDEFAMGSSTENSAYGPARNPYDTDRVPGGSSGGSAVAVAGRTCPVALGSETGGSVRQPASFCGVMGLKPTYGRISRYGLVAFASSLDAIGPISNDALDMAVVLSVIAGHDPRDATSSPSPVPDYVSALERPVAGMRLGIPAEYFGPGLDPEVRGLIERAIRDVSAMGCEPVEVSLPHAEYAIADYYIIAPAEASSNLARYDAVRYGYRADRPQDLADMYKRSRQAGFGPEVKRRIMIGTYALSAGYYEAYYGRAMKVRTLIRQDFQRAFEKADVLLAPVSPTPPFRLGERVDDPLAMYLSDIYTVMANLAGIPAVSVPCGFTASGLPVGLQIMAGHFDEASILRLAHAYLRAHPPAAPPLQV